MPDISMCEGTNEIGVCPMMDECYRHKAKPSQYGQAYFISAPFTEDGCNYLWKDDRRYPDIEERIQKIQETL